MASRQARELAATAWCTESTRNKIMDPILAEAFADIIDVRLFNDNNCAGSAQVAAPNPKQYILDKAEALHREASALERLAHFLPGELPDQVADILMALVRR